jgi:hypothetical protein
MRERIKDADKRYCAECCTMWSRAHDVCRVSNGYCALTPEHKLKFMARERHRLKSWTDEYAGHLAGMVRHASV